MGEDYEPTAADVAEMMDAHQDGGDWQAALDGWFARSYAEQFQERRLAA